MSNYCEDKRQKSTRVLKRKRISSDDPSALQALEWRLSNLTELQTFMKEVNKYYKHNGTCVGYKGIMDDTARKFDKVAQREINLEKRPFQSYEISVNRAKIRHVKQRIEKLKLRDSIEFKSYEFSGGKVVADKELNRVQIFFSNNPDEEIKKEMRSRGFKFSICNGNVWQRQLSGLAINAAMEVVREFEEPEQTQDEDMVWGM